NSQRYRITREPGQGTASPMAFSSDGRMLALMSSTDAVDLIDPQTGKGLVRLPNPRLSLITDLDFSPDGRYLLVSTSSSFTYVWDIQSVERELRSLRLGW